MSKRHRKNWRDLRADRLGREARVREEQVTRLRGDVMRATRAAEEATRAPLNRIKSDALEKLAWRTADAIDRAANDRMRRALDDLREASLASAQLTTSDRWEDRTTVFSVRIPASDYHFTEDVGFLARFGP